MSVRLTGAMFFDVATQAPWVADRRARWCYPRSCGCGTPHRLSRGDPRGIASQASSVARRRSFTPARSSCSPASTHVMSKQPGHAGPSVHHEVRTWRVTAGRPLFAISTATGQTRLRLAATRGRSIPFWLACPRVIKAGDRDGTTTGWLGQFIRLATEELTHKRAGGESVGEAQRVDVHRSRAPLRGKPAVEQSGWLAGLRDPSVGKARP